MAKDSESQRVDCELTVTNTKQDDIKHEICFRTALMHNEATH